MHVAYRHGLSPHTHCWNMRFAHISFLESIILASVTLAYLYPVIQTEIHRHIYSARVTNLANPRPLINPDKTLPRVRIYGYMEKKNL